MHQVLQVMMLIIIMGNYNEAREYAIHGQDGTYITAMQDILENEFLKEDNMNTGEVTDDTFINILGLIWIWWENMADKYFWLTKANLFLKTWSITKSTS